MADALNAGEQIPPPAPGAANPLGFVLDRELSEVHLLLDYVSSCADKIIPATLASDTGGADSKDWLERLCEISWPPTVVNTETYLQAALLIRAKDALNRIAFPANGSTIAFTMLVAQEDNASKERKPGAGSPSSRNSLARTAYPGLISKAKNFRLGNALIGISISAWLVATCVLSWYVAVGNSLLVQFADAKAAHAAVLQKVATEESGSGDRADSATPKDHSKPSPPNSPENLIPAKTGPVIALCDRNRLLEPAKFKTGIGPVQTFNSVNELQLCTQKLATEASLKRAGAALADWHGGPKQEGPKGDPEIAAASAYAVASAWAALLGSAVLPVLYGFLGAGASVVRAISRKTSGNLLSPRDLPISLQQLALGAIVGACIGLFINPQTAAASNGASLLGPVALSSSALSFIAGFGVEGVFRAMEALINRVFGGGAGSQPGAQAKPSGT